MRIIFFIIICFSNISLAQDGITPYKFIDAKNKAHFPDYTIPQSSIFTAPRSQEGAPDIIYYFSKPKTERKFPIAIFCTGSSSKDQIYSIIHIHRHFLREFLDLGVGLITLEQWGVNGNQVNKDEFINHYTRSQRLNDHKDVINSLLNNPPQGWNGKLIFVGVSEGGPLVTSLTTEYSDIILAAINWAGAGDWSWREELWHYIEDAKRDILSQIPWYMRFRYYLPNWLPYAIETNLPKDRAEYDDILLQILSNPASLEEFMGMSYMYHADSLNWPQIEYSKIRSPYLVVTGANDSFVQSSDEFVSKARNAGVKVEYLRVPDMDHYIRKRQDVLDKSFNWIKEIISSQS